MIKAKVDCTRCLLKELCYRYENSGGVDECVYYLESMKKIDPIEFLCNSCTHQSNCDINIYDLKSLDCPFYDEDVFHVKEG